MGDPDSSSVRPPGGAGPAIEAHRFADDGAVPNSPLPALIYRAAMPAPSARDIVARLAENGWIGGWIDGIYPFHHYHATAHEVLVVASGDARVALGGPSGATVRIAAGDVVVLPAGTGHCLESASADFRVCGAYPPGQEDYDLRRAGGSDIEDARAAIARVPLPATDPLTGGRAPLLARWR